MMKTYYQVVQPGASIQVVLFIMCTVCFLLYGFEQGALANVQNEKEFQQQFGHPQGSFLGIVVSIYNLGCFFGCFINIGYAERLGRRNTLWLGFTLIIIGAVLQTSSYHVAQLIVGRFITGLGTGMETATTPLYQSEVCPPHVRGRLVSAEPLSVAVGITMTYWLGYGMSFVNDSSASWRVPLACQMIFALVGFVLLFICPESPRWLMNRNRYDEAVDIICYITDKPRDHKEVVSMVEEIQKVQEAEGNGDSLSWSDILHGRDAMKARYRLLLAWGVQCMNQLGGINLVIYYVPLILEVNVGFDPNMAKILGGCCSMCMLFSIIPSLFLDQMGRRPAMFWGSIAQGFSMMLITILLAVDKENCYNASVAFFFIFTAVFGATMNCGPWVYVPEIVPLALRAKGTAIGVSSNWMWNFFIGMITPVLIDNIAWKTYIIFTITNFVSALIIWIFYPETAKKSLEQIDEMFLMGNTGILFGPRTVVSFVEKAEAVTTSSVSDIENQ